MPIYAALFLIIMLASVGLPGTIGFVGELLAMMGAFEASIAGAFGLNIWYSLIAGFGVVLAAVYLLWMFQKVFYGPVTKPINLRLKDLKTHEVILVGLLLVFVFWGGLYPNTFLKPMEASLGAARLMAIGKPSGRPVWAEPNQEIAGNGDLVEVDRTVLTESGEPTITGTIARADLHFEHENEKTIARERPKPEAAGVPPGGASLTP
jgi:NADH-quinone oxidoreductase subunit M